MASKEICHGPALNGYKDIVLQIENGIATIKLNRPKSLNAFGGDMVPELMHAVKYVNERADVIFTVLYGEGRFFSSGADVMNSSFNDPNHPNPIERKMKEIPRYMIYADFLRQLINHKKVLILAANGPMAGGGAAWFLGVADIVLAADNSYALIPFSALGLIPEQGSGIMMPQSMGYRRAVEFLLFGRKLDAKEMYDMGLVNQIFPVGEFHERAREYLFRQLEANDSESMLLSKELMAGPLRAKRLHAVNESMNMLSERFVDGAPHKRFEKRKAEMAAKSKQGPSKL